MKDLPFAAGVLETLAHHGSATVQNAGVMVRGFVPEQHDYTGPTLRCFVPGRERAVTGFAFTAKMTPLHEQQNIVDWDLYYATLADRTLPTIVVIEDADEPAGRAASMGDMMAHQFRSLGAAGAIVAGSVRDVAGIREMQDFGLWAMGRVPGHGPFYVVDMECPVTVAGLTIAPDDLLVADRDGVTRVPHDEATAIAEACAAIQAKEAAHNSGLSKPAYT